jgi:two-component system response regulator AtoC
VRQLENCVARLVALAGGAEIGPEAFDETPLTADGDGAATAPGASASDAAASLKEQVDAFERDLVTSALAATSGNQSQAARRLRMSRSALIDRVRKYGIS